VGVRHKLVRVGAGAESDDRSCNARASIEDIRVLGSLVELSLRTSLVVAARVSSAEAGGPRVGEEVPFSWRPADQTVHVQND
jgi:hypothetical protein